MGRMAELAMEMDAADVITDPRLSIGGNNPPEPTPLERAEEAMIALSNFLNETPVIENGLQCVKAKHLFERARGAAAEVEAERDGLVRPLNEQVASINGKYKTVHNEDSKKPGTLDKILGELKSRLTAYAIAEEAERIRKAEVLRAAAEQAEAAARQAEQAEQQAKQDAVVGVIDTGVAEKIVAADKAFTAYETASRFAARAEKDATFRIGDGRGKSMSMRTEKTLVLESYGKAIKAIGPSDTIRDAILTAARAYRKQHGCLPDGVSETAERKF